MKKITFIRSAKYWPCDAARHACVLIEDLETKEAYIVSYFPEGCNKLGMSVTQVIYDPGRIMPTCDRDTAILYCRDDSKTIAEIKKLFDTQFTTKKFNLFTRNCTMPPSLYWNISFLMHTKKKNLIVLKIRFPAYFTLLH